MSFVGPTPKWSRSGVCRGVPSEFQRHNLWWGRPPRWGSGALEAKGKGKGKGLDTCYSATRMSQTRDQQRFTISEVAADWHEPMVPQRIMWPSIAHANG